MGLSQGLGGRMDRKTCYEWGNRNATRLTLLSSRIGFSDARGTRRDLCLVGAGSFEACLEVSRDRHVGE